MKGIVVNLGRPCKVRVKIQRLPLFEFKFELNASWHRFEPSSGVDFEDFYPNFELKRVSVGDALSDSTDLP